MRTGVFVIGLALLLCVAREISGAPEFRSAGTDFWVAFPTNDPNNPTPASLSLYYSSETTAVVHTTMITRTTQRRRLGASWGFMPAKDTVITRVDTVRPYSAVAVPVDTCNNLAAASVALPYSVHIQADAPIRVFSLSHKTASSDGLTALPTTMLDTDYVVVAQKSDSAGYRTYASLAVFIATQDNTILTIQATARLRPAQPVPDTVHLNEGQVYMIRTDTLFRDADLTGTRVHANVPFVALGGVERTWMYNVAPGGRSRDHMIEQCIPVSRLGRTYLAAPSAAARSYAPNHVKIVAAFDSTLVTVNDSTTVLNAGAFVDFATSVPTLVTASKPVNAVQEDPSSNNGTGDPFMSLLPPMRGYDSLYVIHCPTVVDTTYIIDQNIFRDTTYWRDTTVDKFFGHVIDTSSDLERSYIANYTRDSTTFTIRDTTFAGDSVYVHDWIHAKVYLTTEQIFFEHHLTALVRDEDVPSFTVDGIHPVGSAFSPSQYCNYDLFNQKAGDGTHVIACAGKFSLLVYGYGSADSYGFIAGLRDGPDDSLDASALDFGRFRIFTSRLGAVLIRNTGRDSAVILSASIVGPDAAKFTCTPPAPRTVIHGGDSLSVWMSFTPDTNRAFLAFLQLCTERGIMRIPLRGRGIAARIIINPPVTDWGQRGAPGRYDSTAVICNIGDDSAVVSGPFVSDHDTSAFGLDSTSFVLHAGECRTVRVTFHPILVGSWLDTIVATSDARFTPRVTAILKGSAAGRVLLVDSIDYKLRNLNAVIDTAAFVTNLAFPTVRIDSLVLAGPDAGLFTVLSPTRAQMPFYLTSLETLWVNIRFRAARPGPVLAWIVVNAQAPTEVILLTGTVRDVVNTTLSTVALDTLCVGSSIDTAVTFRNLGTSPVTLYSVTSSDPGVQFTAAGALPIVVVAGGAFALPVRATARRGTTVATLSAHFAHDTDSSGVATATVTVEGVSDSATMAGASIGPIAVGDSGTACLPVHNTGDEPLRIDAAMFLTGRQFRCTAALPMTVAAGDSACLPIVFVPDAIDTARDTLSIILRGPCRPLIAQAPVVGIGGALRAQIDSADAGMINSCTSRTAQLTVRNLSLFNGLITGVRLADPTAPFTLAPPSLPAAFPAGGTVTIPVTFAPTAPGTYASDVFVDVVPGDSGAAAIRGEVRGTAQPLAWSVRLDSTYHAKPGNEVKIDVRSLPGIAAINAHSVRIDVTYNPTMLYMLAYETVGTALNGFTVDSFGIDASAGHVTFLAHHPAIGIADDTLLLRLDALALVGNAMETPLTLALSLPDSGACAAVTTTPGLFTADSVCGLGQVAYIPDLTVASPAPNPAPYAVAVHIESRNSTALRVDVLDFLGRVVLTGFDGEVTAGSREIRIPTSDLAAGTYVLQVRAPSGTVRHVFTVLR